MSTEPITECPHCGAAILDSVIRQQWTSVGPSTVHCPKCSEPIETGQSEWLDKTPEERARYLGGSGASCTIAVLVFAGIVTLLVAGALYGYNKVSGSDEIPILPAVIVVGASASLLCAVRVLWLTGNEIQSSKRRTLNRKPDASANDPEQER